MQQIALKAKQLTKAIGKYSECGPVAILYNIPIVINT